MRGSCSLGGPVIPGRTTSLGHGLVVGVGLVELARRRRRIGRPCRSASSGGPGPRAAVPSRSRRTAGRARVSADRGSHDQAYGARVVTVRVVIRDDDLSRGASAWETGGRCPRTQAWDSPCGVTKARPAGRRLSPGGPHPQSRSALARVIARAMWGTAPRQSSAVVLGPGASFAVPAPGVEQAVSAGRSRGGRNRDGPFRDPRRRLVARPCCLGKRGAMSQGQGWDSPCGVTEARAAGRRWAGVRRRFWEDRGAVRAPPHCPGRAPPSCLRPGLRPCGSVVRVRRASGRGRLAGGRRRRALPRSRRACCRWGR